MNRRSFLNTVIAGTVAATVARPTIVRAGTGRRFAVSIDDPHVVETPLLSPEKRDLAILDALGGSAAPPSALFVCGMRVDHAAGRGLLGRWNDAKHLIANHSYSHLHYHSPSVTSAAYIADIEKGEKVIEDLSGFVRLFRFPFLKEGETVEKRDAVRSYLRKREYRTGHVSIDASDWYIDDRLRKRLHEKPEADLKPYRDSYLAHLWDRASYYDGLSQELLGRSVPHVILLHHNLLNALFLSDLLEMFKRQGWEHIGADEAFDDPVYASVPDVLPAGEGILWSLAHASGRFKESLRYPAEDSEYEEEKIDRLGL